LIRNRTHVGTGVNDLGGDFGLGPDSDTLVLGEFLDELLLGECPGLVVDLGSVAILSSIVMMSSVFSRGLPLSDLQTIDQLPRRGFSYALTG
jgi:hypothetical protein